MARARSTGVSAAGTVGTTTLDVYGDPSRVTDALIDRYFELTTRAGNRDALVARFEQTKSGPLAARVGEVTAPTLILWGSEDRLIPRESGGRFAREIRGSRLVMLDGLGHVPHEEDPAASLAPVLAFLRER